MKRVASLITIGVGLLVAGLLTPQRGQATVLDPCTQTGGFRIGNTYVWASHYCDDLRSAVSLCEAYIEEWAGTPGYTTCTITSSGGNERSVEFLHLQ